jgi:hypothetical protein
VLQVWPARSRRRLRWDSNGNAYVAGVTYAEDFPTVNATQFALRGVSNGFVSKMNASVDIDLGGATHGETRESAAALSALYVGWGKPADAAKYRTIPAAIDK